MAQPVLACCLHPGGLRVAAQPSPQPEGPHQQRDAEHQRIGSQPCYSPVRLDCSLIGRTLHIVRSPSASAIAKPTGSKLVKGPAESEKFVRWKSMKNSEENSLTTKTKLIDAVKRRRRAIDQKAMLSTLR